MVGPGEVDDDLEPEVKEECNGKYGDVSKVVIFEMPNVAPEEAVRIFIEFKRVESAIKGDNIHYLHLCLLTKQTLSVFSCGRFEWEVFRGTASPSTILRPGQVF